LVFVPSNAATFFSGGNIRPLRVGLFDFADGHVQSVKSAFARSITNCQADL
jgi:hypothetical protein